MSTTAKKKNIFINYRVHDTAGETGRLADRLKQYFSDDQIFMDIDKIEPGMDFTKALSKSLESCDIMLAIIGPNWQGLDATHTSSRIKDPGDWVKTEISTALDRDIKVIPVLVDGAQLPASADLPDDLQPLLLRQSYEISNRRWDYDTKQLVDVLIKSGVQPKPGALKNDEPPKSWWRKNSWWVYILIGVMLIILLVVIIPGDDKTATEDENSTTQTTTTDDVISVPDIKGNWVLQTEDGAPYHYAINQVGDQLEVEITKNEESIGSGNGIISGKDIQFTLTYQNETLKADGTLSNDGESIDVSEGEGEQASHFTLRRQQ